jgi:hypothetical protein
MEKQFPLTGRTQALNFFIGDESRSLKDCAPVVRSAHDAGIERSRR